MEKENYFICRNKNCQPGRWGGDIIEIHEKHEDHIHCPNCKQKYYIDEDKSVYTEFDESPILIESFNEFNNFIDSYTNNFLFIKTLHLNGIADNENFNKTLSYNSCYIENLIIENLDLKTSCPPIVFNRCFINNIIISNCIITEDEKKDFWGSFSFYGIIFNETEVSRRMEIDKYDGDFIFKACEISAPVMVLNSKIHKLNLVANENEPKFEVQNSSIENKYVLDAMNENAELDILPPSKKLPSHEIKDTGNGVIHLKDKHIGNLTFENKDEFHSSVKITNCVIDDLIFQSQVFSQNIEFQNCLFINPVYVSKVRFQKMLCFEASNFKDGFSIDEVNIGTDLHLSYSTFAKSLNLNHTSISGFFNMHHALVEGMFNVERCTIAQNLTLVCSDFEKVNLKTNEFKQQVFFSTCLVNGLFTSTFLKVSGDFDFNKCICNQGVDLSFSEINGVLRYTDCFLSNTLKLTDIEVKGDIVFAQSAFSGKVEFLLCKLDSINLYSNCFESNILHSQGSVEKKYLVNNNVFYENFNLYKLTFVDSQFYDNIFLEKLDLDDTACDDILLETNTIEQLNITNISCGRIESKENSIVKSYFFEILCNKTFVSENCSYTGKTEIYNSSFKRTLNYKNCHFEGFLNFSSNTFGESLILENNKFDWNEKETADLILLNNNIVSYFQLIKSEFNGKTDIIRNNIGQSFEISQAQFNYTPEKEKQELTSFEKGLWIRENNLNNIKFRQVKSGVPLYCEKNLISGSLEIGDTEDRSHFVKPVSISRNRMRAFEIEECQFDMSFCFFVNHVEGGVNFSNSDIGNTCELSGSYFGGAAIFLNISFGGNLILDDTFFDKRLDFRNSNLDKVSFEAATLNGFTLPSNWQLNGGCLCSQGNRNKPILIDEKVLQNKKGNIAFTFQMAGNLFLNDQQKLKTLKKNIRIIKSTYFDGEIDIEQIPPEVINLLYYLPVIEQLLNDEFYPMFYQFVDHEEIELLKSIAATLSSQLQENKIESSISDVLQAFCFDFGVILYAFDAAINDETQNTYYQNIKPILFGRLKDQYLVLKEIYGNNGELGDEDRSYFSWMHYKNLYDFVTSKWYQRPAKIFKWLVFENIFGWGVDLFRIFGSTLLLVLIFSGIYWLGGQISPEVSIRWDDLVIPISKLNYGNILLLTFQTTFAAFMGDWSPAGLGSMKIWMTLNAVLGVLLVAFLIGAYGRKMLR